jgi:hypothetical protein
MTGFASDCEGIGLWVVSSTPLRSQPEGSSLGQARDARDRSCTTNTLVIHEARQWFSAQCSDIDSKNSLEAYGQQKGNVTHLRINSALKFF